jgi:hypothetical protein
MTASEICLPSRSRRADTRGTPIIPQNSFFGHGKMSKSFAGGIFTTEDTECTELFKKVVSVRSVVKLFSTYSKN